MEVLWSPGVVYGFCRLFLFRVAGFCSKDLFFHELFVSGVSLKGKCGSISRERGK